MGARHTLIIVVALAAGCSNNEPTAERPSTLPSATPLQEAAIQRLNGAVKEKKNEAIRTAVLATKDAHAEKIAVESLTAYLRDLERGDRDDQQMIDTLGTPKEGQPGRFAPAEAALENAHTIEGYRQRIKQRSDQRRFAVYARLLVQYSPVGSNLLWEAHSYLAVPLLIEDLQSPEKSTVVRACRILETIGEPAEKALPPLEKLVKKNDPTLSPHAERAIKAIRKT